MQCFKAEYHSRHEQLAKQVHDYFANDYVPRSEHLVDDIQNYCYQLPDVPNTVGLCKCDRPFSCVAKHLGYQDFMSFLCYLAAKTIILMASGIRTRFKTFYYRKDEYIYMPDRNYCRIDDSAFIFKRDEMYMVNMIESFHEDCIGKQLYIPILPYVTLIHRLYPLIKKLYHVEMVGEEDHTQCSNVIQSIPATGILLWEYTYSVMLECQSTRHRQKKLFKEAMIELEYSPPGLLPIGGIQYQKGFERFNEYFT
jgi:hypothetical protein